MNFKATLFGLAVIAALAPSSPSLAAGWTEPLTITRAFTEDSDHIVIYTSGGSQYTPGCSANTWIFVAATEERRARGWATILSALLAGKKLQFWVSDTCAVWSYHKATSVLIAAAG